MILFSQLMKDCDDAFLRLELLPFLFGSKMPAELEVFVFFNSRVKPKRSVDFLRLVSVQHQTQRKLLFPEVCICIDGNMLSRLNSLFVPVVANANHIAANRQRMRLSRRIELTFAASDECSESLVFQRLDCVSNVIWTPPTVDSGCDKRIDF